MELIHMIGFAIVVTALVLVLRDQSPTIAFLLILFASVVMILFVLHHVTEAFVFVQRLAERAQVHSVFLVTIVKMIGIAYIAEFGAHIVRDAQLESLAHHIELIGKVLLLLLAIPILTAVIETILRLLPFSQL